MNRSSVAIKANATPAAFAARTSSSPCFSANSAIREIYWGLQASEGTLVHLSINKPSNDSTLTYANQHRPREIYQDLCLNLREHLHAKVFDWAKYGTIKVARKLQFPPGAKLFLDRGDCDHDWFAHLSASSIHFVTRLAPNTSWVKLEDRACFDEFERSSR